jgi:Cu(I)/Ag(I) efflux system membrane protein CusA/SilA
VRALNPIDAIPDLSENQVLFFYGMDGVKPASDDSVTILWFPIYKGFKIKNIRYSSSMFGMSFVYII